MDLGTGLAILGGKKIIEKILGPTADYIGLGVQGWSKNRVNNIKKIFINAGNKLGHRINEPGLVSPKVLKNIIVDGSFSDDILTVDYFGGILASSRSSISRDDRGVCISALISRLSSYQLRSHYIFYHIFKKLFNGTNMNVYEEINRNKMEVCIPWTVYNKAMDFSKNENTSTIISHVMFGLSKENLIENYLQYGTKEFLKKRGMQVDDFSIFLKPSILGIELFLWAYGRSDLNNKNFFDDDKKFNLLQGINIIDGSSIVCKEF